MITRWLRVNKLWSIALILFAILASTNISVLANRVKVNQNKISDFFDKEVDGKDSIVKSLDEAKKQSEHDIASKGAIQALVVDETELEGKTSELNAIDVNNLATKGREEADKEENSYLNQLEVEYLDPKIINHKKDIDKITDANDKLMSRLIEGLREFDIDCQTVKGDKELEPEYRLEIVQEHFKDTIYNQQFCEELRNQYSCTDSLTLKCRQFSEKPGELTVSQSTMQYNQNIQGLVRNISFVEQYGPIRRRFLGLFDIDSDQSSSYGGTSFFGLINKASGTTYHAQEANWSINFNISTNLAMIGRVQLTDVNYGTFVMFKLNGSVIFVGPVCGNNLFVNGHRSIESKGDRKYGGMVGRRTKVTTNYPLVSTGTTQYALGLDSIASSSTVGVINLLPYVRQGDNILEIKAIGQGRNQVSFNLTASERICTDWQESWYEQCRLK